MQIHFCWKMIDDANIFLFRMIDYANIFLLRNDRWCKYIFVEKWQIMPIYFHVSWNKFSKTWLTNSGFPQKYQEKSSMIFPWLLHAKIQISRQKIPIFVFAAHVSICRINYRQRQMHTHTQTHTWFDQGQPTIQLILLAIELIQEVKTTLFNLIQMDNRFSY